MKVDPVVLNRLLDEVGRYRALSDEESLLVETLILKEQRSSSRRLYQWTSADNRELLRIQHRPGGIQSFADKRGISYKAAFQQLSRLRKLLRGGNSSEQVEG